ncbi:unnamed protein product [Albugo candida]|uniref:Uncharacterized protein n=1 Tax=Albugo candida TaxID=65357 RepID=A0A024GLN5_9STRA|nr:unnamed protein product [Albugo candida]|eukprot:CCI47690.1 unnamed protein product [Albugo candida]
MEQATASKVGRSGFQAVYNIHVPVGILEKINVYGCAWLDSAWKTTSAIQDALDVTYTSPIESVCAQTSHSCNRVYFPDWKLTTSTPCNVAYRKHQAPEWEQVFGLMSSKHQGLSLLRLNLLWIAQYTPSDIGFAVRHAIGKNQKLTTTEWKTVKQIARI